TELIEDLIPELKKRGEVATIKSIHHDVEVDEEGKDTYRHKQAGADEVVGITPKTRFGISDVGSKEEKLRRTVENLADKGYDYLVIEGFSESSFPKVTTGESEAGNVVVEE
ncbi:MAG: molybdopterin-guanine dinucleotide biosynthesis protein B, partial [Halobacteria archaeon]|nr:molybdopterin-guanine dinucleotide biosynthesis protein B [Halobacteria archaeon]